MPINDPSPEIEGRAPDGTAVTGNPVLVGGSDGANVQTLTLKPASTAPVASDPALVVSISPNSPATGISGTVTANQGTPAALANRWPVGITDGTNGLAAIKAASTAPAAADQALVVVLSPNQQAIPIQASPVASTPGISFGQVATAALTQVVVRKTTYNEQTVGAQRSISSANAADTGVGTGAQQVTITWYDSTGAGPFTEVVTLNGVTAVATVATTICFIESMRVTRVGSGGVNAGIITLFVNAAGGGGTIGTIAASDVQTFWTHHYVPAGLTCNVTGVSCSNSATVVGGGAVFLLKQRAIGVVGAVETQVGDTIRLYGQSSGVSRLYTSQPAPIKVVGPARLQMYVTPESATALTQRASFDFYDV